MSIDNEDSKQHPEVLSRFMLAVDGNLFLFRLIPSRNRIENTRDTSRRVACWACISHVDAHVAQDELVWRREAIQCPVICADALDRLHRKHDGSSARHSKERERKDAQKAISVLVKT